jgi:hypothetical protein
MGIFAEIPYSRLLANYPLGNRGPERLWRANEHCGPAAD